MLLGTAVFVAWLFTDHDALEIAGLLVIYGGIAIFLAGIASLFVFVSRAREAGTAYRKSAALALAVLLLNFPLCATYVSVAFAMESAHLVTVVNRADVPIEALTFVDPSETIFRAAFIGPGEVHLACLDFSGEGAVEYSLTVYGETRAGILVGYLAAPLGSRATLRVSQALNVEASEEFRRISLADFVRVCVTGWRS